MALLFMDGFDKYGGANLNGTALQFLMGNEWNSIPSTAVLVAPLSSTGQAAQTTGATSFSKTLGSSVGRIIGGVRIQPTTLGGAFGIQFTDGGSNQCGWSMTASTGIITMRNGNYTSGTILGSSSSGLAANVTHYIEWDITLGNSAAYNIYLDGVSIISGTGDTTATANNTINGLTMGGGTLSTITWDDLYLFDTSGSTNNAVLLTSPRIETTLPTSDSSVQFSIGASQLGTSMTRSTTTFSTATNQFYVRPFTPSLACTLNSISITANATSGSVNLRPVVYSDSSGAPGSLLTTGSTVTGTTSGSAVTMPLTSPPSLSAGTQYWLGYMADIAVSNLWILADATAVGRTATSTFSSGAPGTAPSTTGSQGTVLLWGNITLASGVNFYEVNVQPPPRTNQSYVTDTTVGHEDLYGFPNLSQIPATIYAVAVKAFCARSDAGARTVSLRMNSSGTDSGGSATGQTPGTTYGWLGSNFETDPNGSIAWTGVNLNNATTGFKIDS